MTILLALVFDQIVGEPPPVLHPVVWIGAYLHWVGSFVSKWGPARAFAGGTGFWLLGAAVCVAAAWGAQTLLDGLSFPAGILVGALLIKPLFSLRLLCDEVRGVESALARGLSEGRRQVSRIVSRDTTRLSEAEVRESALESLSENLNDSLVAPLFWYLLLGLPGMALHRFANTADAMWGYRGCWEWAGKWAAVADDVLGWVPARLTAALLLIVGGVRPRAWRLLPSEARLTASPNSGWPMAALALVLRVRLGKPGVYVLFNDRPSPDASSVGPALRLARTAAWLWGFVAAGLAACLGGVLHA